MTEAVATPETSPAPEADGTLMGAPLEAAPVKAAAPEAVKGEAPAEVAIKYEFKAPEGMDPEHFKEAAADVEAFAKAHKLPVSAAQEILAREHGMVQELRKSYDDLATKGWLAELKADKDLGGEKFTAATSQANRAFQKLPDPLRKLIVDNKLSFNPTLFRIMHHFGGMTKEDTSVKAPTQPDKQKNYSLEALFQPKN